MGDTTLKDLLEAGVHFGHQTKRWNPKMKPFLFAEKNGIHIIDLEKTMTCLIAARDAVREVATNGKPVLFVGTKPQAKFAIKEQAERCNMPYVTERWLGGTLTNFNTVR
jgi:small subunit ribosomal protein S2